MQEKKRKHIIIGLEVLCLAILIPTVYTTGFKLLINPIEHYVFEEIPNWLVVLVILGLDVGWIAMMRLCPFKNMNIKIILTLLVLTLSASVLSCLVVLCAMRDAFM